MRYWILVTSKKNWEVCKENNIWGLDYRYSVTLKKFVNIGDKAVVYCHGGNFIAKVEIVSDLGFIKEHVGWVDIKGIPKLYPYRFKIKIIKGGLLHISYSTKEEKDKAIPTNPNPIDNILFIADKSKTWNIYLQVSMVLISKDDFEYISKHL